jgi:hypothetical protein
MEPGDLRFEAQNQPAVNYIELINRPCNPDHSPYHDLLCGHRICTSYPEECSPNCKIPRGSYGFLCPQCIVNTVKVELQLADLSMTTEGDDGENSIVRLGLVRATVEKKVVELRRQGYWRLCTVVEKMDPILQFYDSFLEAHYDEMSIETKPSMKRPSARAAKNKRFFSHHDNGHNEGSTSKCTMTTQLRVTPADNVQVTASLQRHNTQGRQIAKLVPGGDRPLGSRQLDGENTDLVNGVRVSNAIEDEAIKAVREVLSRMALEETK